MNPSTVRRIIATTATAWMLAAGAQAQPPSGADGVFPQDGYASSAALRDRLSAQLWQDARGIARVVRSLS